VLNKILKKEKVGKQKKESLESGWDFCKWVKSSEVKFLLRLSKERSRCN
jgi:hypothetical protein